MKTLLLPLIFILMNSFGTAQNILEALQLKNDLLGEYGEGEHMSTDTLIDLSNGYYEESSASGGDYKTITRQAAIFRNDDGTKTLGITIVEYDFVCFHSKTDFYEIAKTKDSITTISTAAILPELTIREFLTDTLVLTILHKYLPQIRKKYLEANATIDEVLSEIYHIIYLLPQRGTNMKATLKVCDYIPTNVVSITADDWLIIENNFGVMELEYDNKRKKFKRTPTRD